MFDKMAAFASDTSNQTLVTDLVNELSAGLQIPFLLNSSSVYEKEAKYDDLLLHKERFDLNFDNIFSEKEENDLWLDQDMLIDSVCANNKMECMTEVDNLQLYSFQNDELKTYFKTDSSGHGSGSDCSSTELWSAKGDRNVSPMTPPEERISPDSIIFFPNNELHFIPITEGIKQQTISNGTKTVRIKPKPSTALDNQMRYNPSVMCNVFKNGRATINGSNDIISEKVESAKNGKMSQKDSELLQAKRKQERMIRNRESAYLSRKRKKEYVAHLEKQVQDLLSENNRLREENHQLKVKLAKYENEEKAKSDKTRNIFTDSPKKTTALLALLLTFCLNIGSFSNFLHVKTLVPIVENVADNDGNLPFHVQNVRYSRSLLWTSSNIEDLNSLSNLSKTSCPVNQTESIRLESELRRWIKGDEDFSRPFKRNNSRVGGYFFTPNRGTKNQNKYKKKMRSRKMQSSSDVEVDVFAMNPNYLNIDTFLETIHRRDDTFYLVSFTSDHLLLPALLHNQTSRPKMSLMLPTFFSNSTLGVSSDQMEIMQIDCEVTNTKLLSVNENDIPSHVRRYSNSTSKGRSSSAGSKTHYSQYLVKLNKKKGFDENNNDSFRRGTRNVFSLKKANDKNGEDLGVKSKIAKGNEFKFTRVQDGVHIDQGTKEKGIGLKSKNIGEGFLLREDGSKPNNVNNRSNNVVGDGIQFIDPKARNFLKSLIGPALLRRAKSMKYDKKQRMKNYKYAKKFLFP